ncbi:MFS transporter [Ferruginibacter albus]|uniref:MFS transporter n=1 Tax=Ferruginibacter albus TaxID=2875540 RepID=UPI001CC6885A|nr:MFS transporter [Ferruginibacter albus]UAY53483.1 MFS transporter [Ferruginibacter albus]
MEKTIGKYRWTIVGLLFFSTTINYMDRNVIGFLKQYFCSKDGFGWTPLEFSYVTTLFTVFYATFTLFAGAIIDRVGTKLGLAFSLIGWSVFGILNAFVGNTVALHVAIRSLFGAGEAGNFPASIKTVAEWFPKKERALATGIFNSGSNVGAMISAIFVPWCLTFFGGDLGWKLSFIITGAVGFIWLIFWFKFYEAPSKCKKLSKEEYDYIHSDDAETHSIVAEEDTAKVPWLKLLGYKQTWAFFWGKFLTDGIWWFFLFWTPDYLKQQFNLDPKVQGYLYFIILGVAILGSIYGGSIPLTFMNKGWSAYKARMTAMLLIAFAPLLILSTQFFANEALFGRTSAIILAVVILCICASAHQAWSANLFTTVSDMFPKKAVGSVTGIGAAAGGLGGALVQLLAGSLNTYFPKTAYLILFFVCGLVYLLAWAIMKSLVPKHKPITDL